MAQLELLSAVAEQPGARPGQLARQLHMRPNTVTTIVTALAAQGLLSRAAADGDRRAVELTATDAGRQAVHTWQATNSAVLHLALSTLTPAQRRVLAAAVPALDALALASTGWPTRRCRRPGRRPVTCVPSFPQLTSGRPRAASPKTHVGPEIRRMPDAHLATLRRISIVPGGTPCPA